MENIEVLHQCALKELSPKKAYRELYSGTSRSKMKRAHFVKISIRVNEHPGLSILLACLLALPIPIGIVKMFMRKKGNDMIHESFPITYNELFNELFVRGISVHIHAKNEAKIKIKTL